MKTPLQIAVEALEEIRNLVIADVPPRWDRVAHICDAALSALAIPNLQLPPLPEPFVINGNCHTEAYKWDAYTADQMREYAKQTLFAAGAEPSGQDIRATVGKGGVVLTFEQIEDCMDIPGLHGANKDGWLEVSAQGLHNFAHKIAALCRCDAPAPLYCECAPTECLGKPMGQCRWKLMGYAPAQPSQQYHDLIMWLLGENGSFPMRPEKIEGKPRKEKFGFAQKPGLRLRA